MKSKIITHDFARSHQPPIQRSRLQKNSKFKTTMDFGDLVPLFWNEMMPGQTNQVELHIYARLATPLKPVMDDAWFDIQAFFCPLRLLWENFVRQQGEKDNPDDSTDYTTPQCVSPVGGYAIMSLQDQMGLPPLVAGYSHSALPLRAYNLIWNLWYRSQQLQDSLVVALGNGPDDVLDYTIVRRGKRFDMFTAALPTPQAGPDVTVPIGSSSAPIITTATGTNAKWTVRSGTTGAIVDSSAIESSGTSAGNMVDSGGNPIMLDPNGTLLADLSSAYATSINAFREAAALQQLYEIDARGGTRYIEVVKSVWGVDSPDARLQRPELINTSSVPLNIHPVAQTSVAAATPQGNLAAYGTVSGKHRGINYSATEHGIMIILGSARAQLSYQQGLGREWSRLTREDYPMPVFANLGEQAILNKEIYCQGTAGGTDDAEVFGYIGRFDDQRFKNSEIRGLFRSQAPSSLDSWHWAQEFGALPTLSPEFIEDNPPIDRTIAVSSEPHLLVDGWAIMKTAMPLPVTSIPGLTRI